MDTVGQLFVFKLHNSINMLQRLVAEKSSQRFIKMRAGAQLFYAQSREGYHYFWRKGHCDYVGDWGMCYDDWCMNIRYMNDIKDVCIGYQDHVLIIFNDARRVIVHNYNG